MIFYVYMNNNLLKIKQCFLLLQLLLFISFTAAAQTPAQAIPNFTFYRLDKTMFATKDLVKDKKILFVFFDTGCEHCQRAVSLLGDHYGELKNTAAYLVTLDDQEKIKQFMFTYGVKLKDKKNITLLQDTKYQFIPKFGPKKYPAIFLYSPAKKLLLYATILKLKKSGTRPISVSL